MIALIILAGISRCAAPALCPTNEQLRTAVQNRDDAVVQAALNQAAQDDPASFISIHSIRITKISEVLCGNKLPTNLAGEPTAINCKFTVRYGNRRAFQVARLVQRDGRWQIDTAQMVTRDYR